jgi:selenocysteine-specific elongation factor
VAEAAHGRTAVNVSTTDGGRLGRGSVLTSDPAVVSSDRLLVALRPAAAIADRSSSTGLPVDRARVQLHTGTARVTAAVGRTARDSVTLPGGEVTALLRLDQPVAAAPGDRFVLRRPSPGATLGGGRVLDADPPRGVSRKRASGERLAAIAAAVAGGDGWRRARLELHGATDGGADLAPDVAQSLERDILSLVAERGDRLLADVAETAARGLRRHVTIGTAAPRAVARVIDGLVSAERLAREGGRLRDPARAIAGASPELLAAMDRLETALRSPTPPALADAARVAGCPPDGIRALEASGRIIRLDGDVTYASDAFAELRDRAVAMAAIGPLTPAAFRDATGTSRKYVMAILEELDRAAILRRTPAGHVPGPRAGTAVADASL